MGDQNPACVPHVQIPPNPLLTYGPLQTLGVPVKLATVTLPAALETIAVRVDAGELVVLPARDVSSLLASPEWESRARADGPRLALDEPGLVWHPPVRPSKTICIGLNYRTHIEETGRETPAWPTLFGKWPDTLTGPYDPICLPTVSTKVDWEIELGAVVGTTLKAVDPVTARAAIAGYTIVNDISMRDWQSRTSQWLQGKNFERTTPVGPYLVTPDEIDHADDLAMRCLVDGEVVQESRTSDLLFGPAALIAYVSQFTTLRPGDLIATGTPGGVGAGRDPQRFLLSGQTMESSIEGIGVLTNRIL